MFGGGLPAIKGPLWNRKCLDCRRPPLNLIFTYLHILWCKLKSGPAGSGFAKEGSGCHWREALTSALAFVLKASHSHEMSWVCCFITTSWTHFVCWNSACHLDPLSSLASQNDWRHWLGFFWSVKMTNLCGFIGTTGLSDGQIFWTPLTWNLCKVELHPSTLWPLRAARRSFFDRMIGLVRGIKHDKTIIIKQSVMNGCGSSEMLFLIKESLQISK